jgi:hypothetical protein
VADELRHLRGEVDGTVPGTEQFAFRVTGLGWTGDGPAVTTKVERAFIQPGNRPTMPLPKLRGNTVPKAGKLP